MPKILLCDDGKIDEVDSLAKKNDCGIEIQTFYLPERIIENSLKQHEEILKGIGYLSMHGAFADLNPGSLDEKIRNVTRERFDQSVEIARRLNIHSIVFHNGYVPGTRKVTPWLEESLKFWGKFLGDKGDIRFHIENMVEDDPAILKELIDGFALENIDICLDIGHVNCNSSKSVAEWLKVLGSRVGYVHLHDNNGVNDDHLGLGEGTLPIGKTLEALSNYASDAIWAIESKGEGMRKSMQLLDREGIYNFKFL